MGQFSVAINSTGDSSPLERSHQKRSNCRPFCHGAASRSSNAMPYQFERSRPGSLHADYMLSANLDRTMQAVRQAVVDGIKLILWLKSEGYREISVLGMSRGSWVGGLIAAHDANVWKASLFLTGGGLADMVWTGRATRSIRSSLEPEIDLADPRRAWTHSITRALCIVWLGRILRSRWYWPRETRSCCLNCRRVCCAIWRTLAADRKFCRVTDWLAFTNLTNLSIFAI
jgi:hypothetical protein